LPKPSIQIPQESKPRGEGKFLLEDVPNLHKFSNYSKLFIADLLLDGYKKTQGYLPSEEVINKYPTVLINRRYYIGALLEISDSFRECDLKIYGVLIGSRVGNILSVKIPIENIVYLSEVSGIDFIEIDKPVKPQLDQVRNFTLTNYVHQGYQLPESYTGKNVIVGVIDRGFDFTHPVFWDTTYTRYRIQRLWDMGKNIGNPPGGYQYGTEVLGGSNIRNWLYDVQNETHGTHVAGIAAGGFSGNPVHRYKGIAPECELVIISTGGYDSQFIDGINYVFNYATTVNRPAVVNLSWGAHIGPHDGTSLFDKAIDNLVGPGKIVVGAAGNEGGDSIHLSKTFTSTDTLLYSFVEFPYLSGQTDGRAIIDVWGAPNTSFRVFAAVYNINKNSFEDYTSFISSNYNSVYVDTLYDKDPFFPDRCIVKIIPTSRSWLNNKPNILIYFDNTDQDNSYKYVLIGVIGRNTSVHAWTSKSSPDSLAIFVSKGYGYPVKSGNTDYTVGEIGGTGKNIISVGAFTTKNTYTDFAGGTQYIPFYASIGAIAPFSSKGPTVDGRIKPDISAPGNVVVSSVSRFDSHYNSNSKEVVSGLTDRTNTWWFATMQGTSMSAPVVTGIIALMLQASPRFSPSQIKQIFQTSAITDNYTGITPNNAWGWGKVNAYAALRKIVVAVAEGKMPKSYSLYQNYPNPFNPKTTIEFETPERTNVTLVVYDVLGREIEKLVQKELEPGRYKVNFDAKGLPGGVYFYTLKTSKSAQTKKMLLIK